ncbi:hypothetical protein BDC45DRAFT_518972, partial [Circinella umbellata]
MWIFGLLGYLFIHDIRIIIFKITDPRIFRILGKVNMWCIALVIIIISFSISYMRYFRIVPSNTASNVDSTGGSGACPSPNVRIKRGWTPLARGPV